ncbi:MAG: hypothetical protein K6E54_10415, partial [Bacteroidaceae bacterium]|nr:hypothetical protein [Bacteroidaceae bacterium]
MKANLYLVQNLMIFMEECFLSLPSHQDYYTLNPFYIKEDIRMEALKKEIYKIFPDMEYIPYDNCSKYEFDTIYMSSYMPIQHQKTVESMNYNKIVLVEDGLFDYVNNSNTYDFYKGKELYVFRPGLCSKEAGKSNVHLLELKKDVVNIFEDLYRKELDSFKNYPVNTPILFTTPLSEDFGADAEISEKILDLLSAKYGINTLIVKKHPRDHFDYVKKNFNIIECPQ